MRSLLLPLVALVFVGSAVPCDCFSPEMRAKTARDTLELARLAAFGKIVEARPDGSSLFVVAEAFKGATKGQSIAVGAGEEGCASKRPRPNDSVLLLSFEGPVTACGAYEADHFLVQEFRALQPS
jgi:hypothetical protein